jgi:hypothetical protein
MATGAHRTRIVLAPALVTGVLILMSGLAGCAAGGGKAPAATGTPAATAAASSPGQSWQQALGAGVTVTEPPTPAPGLGSPGAAVHGVADAQTVAGCRYYEPSAQAECRAIIARVPRADLGTSTGFRLGYVAVDGDRALVGFTGTVCQPGQHPECVTNRDPAAIFSTAKPFATLWTESIASANSPILSYALTPCMRISGRWYLYSPTGQSASPV